MPKEEITVAQTPEAGNVALTAKAAVKAVKAGRAKDVDIAAQIIAAHGQEMDGETWSVAEEKKLMRKVDWHLIPIVNPHNQMTSSSRSRLTLGHHSPSSSSAPP